MLAKGSSVDLFGLALRSVAPEHNLITELDRLEDVALHLYDGLACLRVKLTWQEMQVRGVVEG